MKGTCETCLYCRRLVHNFIPGEGWCDGTCCIVFAESGPVYETDNENLCEHWTQKEIVEVETNIFDRREVYEDCTVEVLQNSATGEISVGWWENDNPPEEV